MMVLKMVNPFLTSNRCAITSIVSKTPKFVNAMQCTQCGIICNPYGTADPSVCVSDKIFSYSRCLLIVSGSGGNFLFLSMLEDLLS